MLLSGTRHEIDMRLCVRAFFENWQRHVAVASHGRELQWSRLSGDLGNDLG